jgi:hypothetical protein
MSQRVQPTPRRLVRGTTVALCALALLAPPLPAQPPADNPRPLFNPLGLAQPAPLGALGVGASAAPQSGPWGVLSTVYAGAGPEAQAWGLEGVLSTRPGREQLGAATLFLTGFGGRAAPPAALAVLQAGDGLGCWELLDTDRLRPFPEAFKDGRIQDGKDIGVGTPETAAYAEVLTLAHYTSDRAFRRAARSDVLYYNLFNEPAQYRGDVVRVEGRLRRLLRWKPPPEAAARGVNNLYEAWLFNDDSGYGNPFCAVFTELPPGLTPRDKFEPAQPVSFAGYFFKKFRYQGPDKKWRDAPLLIGHTLTVRAAGAGPAAEAGDNWAEHLGLIFLGVVATTVCVVVALTWWFRRSDVRVRRRLLAARGAHEFVPPPPDVAVAQPVEPAAGDNGAADRPGPARPPGSRVGGPAEAPPWELPGGEGYNQRE